MAWDSEAKKLAIKAIGTVESNLKYDAIYYADPITIGIMQWYAGRAAHILDQLKNAPLYSSVEASLRNDVAAHPYASSWTWWSNRYLTKAEGNSLKALLTSNEGVQVQNNQTLADLQAYAVQSRKDGLDPDTNTNAFIYWCVAYHQSPREARRILAGAGDNPSIDRLHSLVLNNTIFRQYPTRYNRARAIILAGDTSGVPDMGVPVGDDDAGGDSNHGDIVAPGIINHVRTVGDTIHVVFTDGSTVVCWRNVNGYYRPSHDGNNGGPDIVAPTPNPNPEVPGSADAIAKRNAVVKWMTDRLGRFSYSQGSGRMNPDASGVGDCSSTVWRAYRDTVGITLGTWTEAQYKQGQRVWSNRPEHGGGAKVPPLSILAPGDLIFFRWRNSASGRNVNHVEMVADPANDRCVGHGGPGKGPKYGSITANCNLAQYVNVQRHIT